MTGHLAGKEVCAIDIHTPELLQTIGWVCNGVKVLREAGRSDQVVDLSMVLDNVGDDRLDRVIVRDVAIVGSDFGNPIVMSARYRSQAM